MNNPIQQQLDEVNDRIAELDKERDYMLMCCEIDYVTLAINQVAKRENLMFKTSLIEKL